jgi:putative glutamine amidotransferase
LIGLVAEHTDVDIHGFRFAHHVAADYYVDAIVRAGGLPVVLPLVAPEDASAFVDRVDGILLTGGVDIDPATYGHEREPETVAPQRSRDEFELALVETLVERNTPTLGICRGLQTINVACGGTLVQHLTDHPRVLDFEVLAHDVEVVAGSRLASIVGTEPLATNSLHHQGLGRLGDRVRVVGTAHGLVEAIEVEGADRILAVQWHPETLDHLAPHRTLFEDLVTNASN